jgi:hypothetical protein
MAKRKLSKKQKETIKRMKETRQIDSDNLRHLIEGKLEWAKMEIAKGKKKKEELILQIERLKGIVIFIEDLLQPPEEDTKKGK